MSSHHFVRDGQEPALFITHPEPQNHPYFEQLAGWNPVIICTGEIIPLLEAAGVAWDHVLVGRNAEISSGFLRSDPTRKCHIVDQADAGTVIAKILNSYDCGSLRLLTSREEDFDAWESLAAHVPLTVVSPRMYWVFVSGEYRRWFPRGTSVWLNSSGSEQITVNDTTLPRRSEWKAETDGMAVFSSKVSFWLGEVLGA